MFKIFLIRFKGLWMIRSESMKQTITKWYLSSSENNLKIKKYHKRIANALEKTPTSLRKLDELTFHYYKSEDFFLLKETVSNIENFLLLFNPNNKYDLCRYWQKLEEKGFDPAIEYNKAIEG